MSSLSVVLQPSYVESGLNVGEYINRALALKQAAQEKKFEFFNAPHDNFPFLLKQSGLHDRGFHQKRWVFEHQFLKTGGYSSISMYQLRGIEGLKPLRTNKVLEQLSLLHTAYATTRELLGLFVSHREEVGSFLKRKQRIVALGGDVFHPFGAAILYWKRGVFYLGEIPDIGQVIWRPSDIFLTRVKDLS